MGGGGGRSGGGEGECFLSPVAVKTGVDDATVRSFSPALFLCREISPAINPFTFLAPAPLLARENLSIPFLVGTRFTRPASSRQGSFPVSYEPLSLFGDAEQPFSCFQDAQIVGIPRRLTSRRLAFVAKTSKFKTSLRNTNFGARTAIIVCTGIEIATRKGPITFLSRPTHKSCSQVSSQELMSAGNERSKIIGKICLVTGASRGIGRGIALQLSEAGATVYITGRPPALSDNQTVAVANLPTLEKTAEEVNSRGGKGIPVYCDHSNPHEVKPLPATAQLPLDAYLSVCRWPNCSSGSPRRQMGSLISWSTTPSLLPG